MTKTVALLPCPFCGKGAAIGGIADKPPRYFVNCVMCQGSKGEGLGYATEADAIAAWNTRTQTDQQLREALAELEQQATATLGAIDRYNEENGTSLGGAPMFKLGRAIARARSYLSSSSLTK